MTPFNKPTFTGNEVKYLNEAVKNGHLSGDGPFSKRVIDAFKERFQFPEMLLTHSCTGALEIAALALELGPGDEVIIPAFTHVNTANAFARTGAEVRFADSLKDHPNVDPESVRELISPRTKAVVVVHYAGMPCKMDELMQLVSASGVALIEDAAHALGSTWHNKNIGSFGDFACFSFHETKNIHSGHGGMLVINNSSFLSSARQIWYSGTNRREFKDGLVSAYTWQSIGSSYQMPDLNAAFLYAQVEKFSEISERRVRFWNMYYQELKGIAGDTFELPKLSEECCHSSHIFYLVTKEPNVRRELINSLKDCGAQLVFHYQPLNESPYYRKEKSDIVLPNSSRFGNCLVRLPLFDSLGEAGCREIVRHIHAFISSFN